MNIPLKGPLYTDEFEIAQGCLKGLAAAQNALYKKYAPALLILCIRYVSNGEEAREIMMDAFVNCYKHFKSFQYVGEGSLQAWLRRIAVNQCLMFLRKNNVRFLELGERHVESVAEQEDVLAQLNAREIMLRIHELPPGYRAVFNMYVFEEMQHKEIASALGISESTSKTQLYKARLLLQKKLSTTKENIL